MKLLIFIGLVYLVYRAAKSVILSSITVKTVGDESRKPIEDIMVKDPYCEVYFPEREGYPLKVGNETLYFCSAECRDEYIKKIKG